jgi:L-alanine-DL-glutamate epimerase-like enolase superfamily enzyme
MDEVLKGHGYAKSAFDAACWDILGKSTGLPVYMLLGGKLSEYAPIYRVVPQAAPDAMAGEMQKYREAGYRYSRSRWARTPMRISNEFALLFPI